jgi:hypothetical protein
MSRASKKIKENVRYCMRVVGLTCMDAVYLIHAGFIMNVSNESMRSSRITSENHV